MWIGVAALENTEALPEVVTAIPRLSKRNSPTRTRMFTTAKTWKEPKGHRQRSEWINDDIVPQGKY